MAKAKETGLSPREAALRLGIGLDFVYRELWSGKLPGRKEEGRWVIPATTIEERLVRRRGNGTAVR